MTDAPGRQAVGGQALRPSSVVPIPSKPSKLADGLGLESSVMPVLSNVDGQARAPGR